MKPYGREKKIMRNIPDYHPRKGWRNWWDDMCDFLSRSTMKQKLKKEIDKELEEDGYTTTSTRSDR